MAPRPPPPALSDAPLAPGLYLVATPIGNLRDITLRALDVLAAADLVLAEDTRVSAKLLAAYGLSKRVERYDEHAAARATPKIMAALAGGGRIALISDAGTPLVSDPGYRLALEAIAAGVAVFPIPGASAALAALSVAGLPTDRFLFAGFPPPKSAARRAFLQDLKAVRATLILFEGASRLGASLADMAAVLGPRPAAVARELTKLHETLKRGEPRRPGRRSVAGGAQGRGGGGDRPAARHRRRAGRRRRGAGRGARPPLPRRRRPRGRRRPRPAAPRALSAGVGPTGALKWSSR